MSQHPDQPVDPTTPYAQQPPVPPQPSYGQGYGQQGYAPAGTAAHWSALAASTVALAFLGPLLVLLTKGAESPYVRRQAVESLNFQLSMLIYVVVSAALMLVLIGFLLVPIVAIAWLVLTIMGTVKASNGEEYRYPLTIRMVS